MQTLGISPNIDSCAGLVAKLALRSYSRLSAEHRRWLDPEDLIQEAYISAHQADLTHVPGAGQKYSTRAFTAIDWGLKHVHTGLGRSMRRAVELVELDGTTGKQYADATAVLPVDGTSAFKALVATIIRLGPVEVAQAASTYLVAGLLLGVTSRTTPEVVELLGRAGREAGVSYQEIRNCATDEKTRKKVLLWASEAVIMNLGAENKLRCLVCVRCDGRFTLAALREGRFSLDTSMCRACYREMADSGQSCFAKEFSTNAVECRLHCPDRQHCRSFTPKDHTHMSTAKGTTKTKSKPVVADELEGLDSELAAVDTAAAKTTKPKKVSAEVKAGKSAKAKAGKSKPAKAKPAKAVKPVEAKTAAEPKTKKPPVVDEAGPAELGGVWPWRAGSVMRFCFRQCYEGTGVSHKKFESFFEKGAQAHGYKADYMLKKMRTGLAGKTEKTHSWRLNEEGGRYKIYDARYLLGKKAKPAADAVPVKAKKNKKKVAA